MRAAPLRVKILGLTTSTSLTIFAVTNNPFKLANTRLQDCIPFSSLVWTVEMCRLLAAHKTLQWHPALHAFLSLPNNETFLQLSSGYFPFNGTSKASGNFIAWPKSAVCFWRPLVDCRLWDMDYRLELYRETSTGPLLLDSQHGTNAAGQQVGCFLVWSPNVADIPHVEMHKFSWLYTKQSLHLQFSGDSSK